MPDTIETIVTPPAAGTPAAASVNSSDWIKVAAAQLVEAGNDEADAPAPKVESKTEEPKGEPAEEQASEADKPKAEEPKKEEPKAEASKELEEARKVKTEAIKLRADLLKAQRRLEERKLQVEAAAKQNEQLVTEARGILQRLKTEPYKLIEELGVGSFADWQARQLRGEDTSGGPTPKQIQDSLPQMLEQLKSQILAEMKQATEPLLQERERARVESTVGQYKASVRDALAADPLVQRYGVDRALTRAMRAAEDHAATTGEAVDSAELAAQTIRELLEEAKLLGAAEPEAAPKPTPAARPNGGTKRTPDNAASSTRATRDPNAAQSRDEWIKEAARQLREAKDE